MDIDLKIKIETPLNEDRKWTGTDTTLDPGIPSAWDHSVYSTPLRGDAIKVADFDTGIDVFHPAFFNFNNVPVNWVDDNSNSIFEWGIDAEANIIYLSVTVLIYNYLYSFILNQFN